MVGSVDSLDFCTELPVTEKNAIPLDCWQNICLSNIWIPSDLLPSRTKSSNSRVTKGIFHTLERKDPSRYLESFSVYSNPQSEQGEIFLSDSDEDIFCSNTSLEKIESLSDNALSTVCHDVPPINNACSIDRNYIGNNLNENFNKTDENLDSLTVNVRNSSYLDKMYSNEKEKATEVVSSKDNLMNNRGNKVKNRDVSDKNLSKSNITKSLETFATIKEYVDIKENKETDSLNSLKEILDDTPQINIKDFDCDFKKYENSTFVSTDDTQESNSKKNKKGKKKLNQKYITLDKFLEGGVAINQDYYCEKYFESIQHEKNITAFSANVPIRSNAEFPDLKHKVKFIHSDKATDKKDVELSYKCLTDDLIKSDADNKNENIIDADEIKLSITDIENYGKIVIENIPQGVSEDDISLILCGYGEIKNFSLISAGNFLKAYVEIDLIGDIDWIIECLDGTDPFGASSEMIKCYKQ